MGHSKTSDGPRAGCAPHVWPACLNLRQLVRSPLAESLDICWTGTVRIVSLQGLPSTELITELVFGFPIETIGTTINAIAVAIDS